MTQEQLTRIERDTAPMRDVLAIRRVQSRAADRAQLRRVLSGLLGVTLAGVLSGAMLVFAMAV